MSLLIKCLNMMPQKGGVLKVEIGYDADGSLIALCGENVYDVELIPPQCWILVQEQRKAEDGRVIRGNNNESN